MSKKIKELEAELQEEKDRNQYLEQLRAQDEAAAREEEEKRKNRPVAMEEYYNIAYAKERQRLNEMFGRINYSYTPEQTKTVEVEKIVYRDKEGSVPQKKHKKTKSLAGFFIATTIIFAAIAIVLAIHTFVTPFLPIG